MYRIFNTPSSLEALRTQLLNYYPGQVVDTLIEDYHVGSVDMPTLGHDPDADVDELKRLYGRIASDAQIRAPTRLLLSQLEAAGVPIDRVRRYRVAWMPSFSSQLIPNSMGVPHGGDTPAFNYSVMHGANGQDKRVMDEWIRNLVSGATNVCVVPVWPAFTDALTGSPNPDRLCPRKRFCRLWNTLIQGCQGVASRWRGRDRARCQVGLSDRGGEAHGGSWQGGGRVIGAAPRK